MNNWIDNWMSESNNGISKRIRKSTRFGKTLL